MAGAVAGQYEKEWAMVLEVFSVVVLVGALIVLIPTARRVFRKGDDE